ncbi:hypothetical protein D3C84_1287430 [compost metagenome]
MAVEPGMRVSLHLIVQCWVQRKRQANWRGPTVNRVQAALAEGLVLFEGFMDC